MEEKYAYAAGIIDGEGHIGISLSKTSKGNNCYYARLTVHMKDPEGVQFLCDLFNKKIKTSFMNSKKYYSFYCNSKEMISSLNKIIPYLKVKKKIALIVLELLQIDYKRQTLYIDGKFRGSQPVPVEIEQMRAGIFARFQASSNHYKTKIKAQ